MTSFNDLPLHVITEIFLYVPRKDRISCSMVCSYWREALDSSALWKNMVVYLDSDLTEPSTVLATRLYHRHFKAIEFCWANPRLPARWMQHGLQEISKKSCHYIMILQDLFVQLNTIKIADWNEVPRFKKIIYHLCKFLRSQIHLINVSFFNTNFNTTECIKLLAACLGSVSTIKYLDINNCHHPSSSMYESVAFISCMEHLSNLLILKIDYAALSEGVIDALLTSRNAQLKYLDVTVQDYDHINAFISEQTWKDLHLQCPKLEVALYLRNICHFEDIHLLLSKTIPLTTFSLCCGRIWDQSRSRQYRRTILLLMRNYRDTLESVQLQMNYNREILDDLILALIHNCINLKYLDFNGMVESVDLLREICKIQSEGPESDFKYFRVVPKNMNAENHYFFTKLHRDFAKELEERNVDFKICNAPSKNLVYVYY